MTHAERHVRKRLREIYRRWLEDEKFFDELATRQPAVFSNANEVLRNLGSAIAYAQRMAANTSELTVNDRRGSQS
jgi:hypothetical protein